MSKSPMKIEHSPFQPKDLFADIELARLNRSVENDFPRVKVNTSLGVKQSIDTIQDSDIKIRAFDVYNRFKENEHSLSKDSKIPLKIGMISLTRPEPNIVSPFYGKNSSHSP